jgi:toxin ParE1/3/4
MVRVIVTDTASADQAYVLKDLDETAGRRVALRFLSMFRALYQRLADHPASGPIRPALGPNIRIGIVTPISSFTDMMRAGTSSR